MAQQWDTLRHVARLMVRLGAENDAATLQRCFVEAGREPPLSDDRIVIRARNADQAGPTGVEALEFARALRRYC